MNIRNKLIRTLMACLLLAGVLLAGCNAQPSAAPVSTPAATDAPATQQPATQPPEVKLEPYQIDWLQIANGYDERVIQIEQAVNKILESKINATVKINLQGWGDHMTKVDTLISSGEKIDMVFTADWWGYQGWVGKGYFMPLNDLMAQYAPETVKMLEEEGFIAGTAINGVNYGVPTLKETVVPEGIVFNKAYLDKYGWDKNSIKKVADLEPWLAQIKANEPGVIPYLYAGRWADTPFTTIVTEDLAVYLDGRDTQVHLIWDMPEMKERLNLMRQWNLKGFFSPDVGTDAYDETAVLKTAQFFANPQGVKGENVRADELQATALEGADYVDITFEDSRYIRTPHVAGSMQSIPVTSKDPARVMMFIELMHMDVDVENALAFGAEGVNYTKTDKPGIIKLNPENKLQDILFQWTIGNVYIQYVTTDEDPDKLVKLKAQSEGAKLNFVSGFFFDSTSVENELAAIATVRKELDTALQTGLVDPNEKLPEMIAKLKEAGIEKVQAEVQKQLDAWLTQTGEK